MIPGRYVLTATHQLSVRVGAYDAGRPLVIDPVLAYSTYLGGDNFDRSSAIAVDPLGNAYVTGFALSTDFPTTAGAVQATFGGGGEDAFVTKLNPTGSGLVYSTYLGGTSNDEAWGIGVDAAGSVYVTGFTLSTDFPATAGAYQTTFFGWDAFVTKLDPTGSSLVYSTSLGVSDEGFGIAVDALGNAYVTGISFPSIYTKNFPTTPGAFQTTFGGVLDAFVTKLNPTGSALVYSTYLGGKDYDEGYRIAVDALGNAYVTGPTQSTDFPTTTGAFQTTFGGVFGYRQPFVTKLNPTGSALVYSTYLGGRGDSDSEGIAVDALGNAYVTGNTTGAFPTTAGAFQTTLVGDIDAFVAKVNSAGSALVYSTYLGRSGNDQGKGIAVDAAGNAYVTGLTGSTDFPTTAGAFQATFGGGFYDAFVTKLDPTGSGLVYSTYLGGTGSDQAWGIAVVALPSPNAYVTGDTSSTDFPTTTRAFQTTAGGLPDAFVVKITESAPPPTVGKVTGGGTIDVPGGAATFGFIVQAQSTTGPIGGNLQYVNQASGAKVHSVMFDSLIITTNTATFGGTCTNNGVPCTFTVRVQDNGATATNDSFVITIDAGPPEGSNETLRSGNILIHH